MLTRVPFSLLTFPLWSLSFRLHLMNALPCCCGLQLTFCLTRTFRFIRQHQLPFSSVSARLPLHDPCREYTANSFPTHSVYSLSVFIPLLLFRFITDTSNYSVLRPTRSEFLVENSTPLVIGQFCNHFMNPGGNRPPYLTFYLGLTT
jgi:hypothetical protein